MKRLLLLLVFCLCIWGLPACSTGGGNTNTAPPAPRIKYAGDVIALDANGTASVEFENGESKSPVTAAELKSLFASKGPNSRDNARLLIAPDRETRAAAVLEVIDAVQPFYKANISVLVSEDLTAFVAWGIAENSASGPAKPDPLTLVASVDDRGDIFLNRDPNGSMSNLTPLSNRLKELFKSRADNGVFRVGAPVVETTVLMKLPPAMVWRDVRTLAVTIRNSGSDRIGLLVKDEERFGNALEK